MIKSFKVFVLFDIVKLERKNSQKIETKSSLWFALIIFIKYQIINNI